MQGWAEEQLSCPEKLKSAMLRRANHSVQHASFEGEIWEILHYVGCLPTLDIAWAHFWRRYVLLGGENPGTAPHHGCAEHGVSQTTPAQSWIFLFFFFFFVIAINSGGAQSLAVS